MCLITAGRGKKDDIPAKDVEKSINVITSESEKLGSQTPGKKNVRGGSSSSTERYLYKTIYLTPS